MLDRLVAIESPYAGNVRENEAFARAVARQVALEEGLSPYVMHLFFTRFLDDLVPEERTLGISAGLVWTDAAFKHFYSLREGEEPSRGMKLSMDRHLARRNAGEPVMLENRVCTPEGKPLRAGSLEGEGKFVEIPGFQEMPRVLVDVEVAGPKEASVDLLMNACRSLVLRGISPYAPRLLLPQFLDMNNLEERATARKIAHDWLGAAEAVWTVVDSYKQNGSRGFYIPDEVGEPPRIMIEKDGRIRGGLPLRKWPKNKRQ